MRKRIQRRATMKEGQEADANACGLGALRDDVRQSDGGEDKCGGELKVSAAMASRVFADSTLVSKAAAKMKRPANMSSGGQSISR